MSVATDVLILGEGRSSETCRESGCGRRGRREVEAVRLVDGLRPTGVRRCASTD